MKILNWNINGLNARYELLEQMIKETSPDVVTLQESKMTEMVFNAEEYHDWFNKMGYHAYLSEGLVRGHSGVLILVKDTLKVDHYEVIHQGRVNYVSINGHLIVNVYINQGQAIDSSEYFAKKDLLRLIDYHLTELKVGKPEFCHESVTVIGDYNICPEDIHVWSVDHWHEGVVSRTPREIEWFNEFQHLLDLHNIEPSNEELMTWYGYRHAWRKTDEANQRVDMSFKYGVKCDHALTTKEDSVMITLPQYRFGTKNAPSDHIPMFLGFE